MKINRRGFFKRVAGVSALLAVPLLGVAKAITKKPLEGWTYTEGEMDSEISHEAESELANMLAQEMVDEVNNDIIKSLLNAPIEIGLSPRGYGL